LQLSIAAVRLWITWSTRDQGNAVARACKYCGVMDVLIIHKCSGCKVVWYCGTVSQKKDWKEGGEDKHKLQCPKIKEQRELYKENKKEEAKEEVEEINERLMRGRRLREAFEQMLRGDGASSSSQ
jgi:benzoyl-CoA reductase/2-hydroxyglutaryl-CoA dehydratase subunit BcrC/BadD/HgdB